MALHSGILREISLFSGAGGGILASKLLGHRIVCAVEKDSYRRELLLRRQNDGLLELFPIWDCIETFEGKPWNGKVDIVSGGFPCQDISIAGKGLGLDGERSGLWFEMFRVICEIRPRIVFVENVPTICIRGLDRILGCLATIGYNAAWKMLSFGEFGAPHYRKRFWLLASNNLKERIQGSCENKIQVQQGLSWLQDVGGLEDLRNRSDLPESIICRNSNGIPNWMDRLAALGDAQVPIVAAISFVQLAENLGIIKNDEAA